MHPLKSSLQKIAVLGLTALLTAGCVYEPYPPPAPVAAAPGYYSYYEYPAPYYYSDPAVGVNFNYHSGWGHGGWDHDGWGGHHWH